MSQIFCPRCRAAVPYGPFCQSCGGPLAQAVATKPGSLNKKVLIIVGALAVVFIAFIIIGVIAGRSRPQVIPITAQAPPPPPPRPAPPAPAKAPPAPPAPAQESGVTLANYNRLKEGMSYNQVVAILGSEGKELSSSSLGGYKMVMYQWNAVNGRGANMNAVFQNGKLFSKAQAGLK